MDDKLLVKLLRFKNENYRRMVIDRLLDIKLPVVIYGTGKFAMSVAEKIIELGLDIIFCDLPQFYSPSKTVSINGRKYTVLSEEELCAFKEKYVLLSGIIDPDVSEKLMRKLNNCQWYDYLDVYNKHFMDWEFVYENKVALESIYSEFEDDESREVFISYLLSRLTGNVKYIEGKYENTGFSYAYDILDLQENDVIVDGGAYRGDTILEIETYLSAFPFKIYAFEPDAVSYEILKMRFSNNNRIKCFRAGLYNRNGEMGIISDGTMGTFLTNESTDYISVKALDLDSTFDDVSVVKMDIEGSELDGLRGMERLIKKNIPNIAVCIYHNNRDIIDIYNFFSEMKLPYHYYLRQHSRWMEETVFYAIK